jgi:hypothetical protein
MAFRAFPAHTLRRLVACLTLLGGALASDPASADTALACTRHEYDGAYCGYDVEGWSVHLSAKLVVDEPDLARDAFALLGDRLRKIVEALPPARLDELRRVPIWMEMATPGADPLMYHPAGSAWPREHGFPDAKMGSLDITDATEFLRLKDSQPSVVLHEMAHGYHDQFLGPDNRVIRAAYKHAVDSGLYAQVARNDGRIERGYALTNAQEYFAELSEAYFGENDFFPFHREELRDYDPKGFAMMRALWEERAPIPEQRLGDAGKTWRALRACTKERDLRSRATRQRSRIVIRNDRASQVSLFWLDWRGWRRSYGEVPAGGLGSQPTYVTHPWLVTGADGKCLGIVLPEKGGTWVRL